MQCDPPVVRKGKSQAVRRISSDPRIQICSPAQNEIKRTECRRVKKYLSQRS